MNLRVLAEQQFLAEIKVAEWAQKKLDIIDVLPLYPR